MTVVVVLAWALEVHVVAVQEKLTQVQNEQRQVVEKNFAFQFHPDLLDLTGWSRPCQAVAEVRHIFIPMEPSEA